MFDGKQRLTQWSILVLGLMFLAASPVGARIGNDENGPRLPPGMDPGNDEPTPPARPTLGNKTTSSLDVRWNGTSKAGQSYRLLRISSGNTTVIASGIASATTVTITDSSLTKDTSYCYQAEVDEPDVGPLRSPHICGYTLAGQTITRLEILLETADIDDANTDDAVFVSISGVQTWLDHNIDDRERGDVHRYDLTLVGDTADIRLLTVGKTGSDGWCVKRLTLLVNGGSMFHKSFANHPSGCLWLDNEGGASRTHHILTAELRAHPDWATYPTPLPTLTETANGYTGSFEIRAAELRQRIEGMVGDAIHGTPLYWPESGPGVEVAPHPTQGNAVHVIVHVKGEGFGPNATITIDFDLVFNLGQTDFGEPIAVSITDANFDVHSTGSWDDDGAEDDVRDEWPGVDLGFQIDVDAILETFVDAIPDLANYLGRCCDTFDVEVDAQANVTLSGSLSPAPAPGGVVAGLGNGGVAVFKLP